MKEEWDINPLSCALFLEPDEFWSKFMEGPAVILVTNEVVARDEMRVLLLCLNTDLHICQMSVIERAGVDEFVPSMISSVS
jgi:hypothetical protein